MQNKPYGPGKLLLESIRKNNFKLIHNYELDRPSFQLYNLDYDITEQPSNNLGKKHGATNDKNNKKRNNSNENNSKNETFLHSYEFKYYQDLIEEMYTELQKIGPCYDRSGRFKVAKQGTRSNDGERDVEFVRRNCAWFRKEPEKTARRCRNSKEGRKYCRRTCMSHLRECEIPNVNDVVDMFIS